MTLKALSTMPTCNTPLKPDSQNVKNAWSIIKLSFLFALLSTFAFAVHADEAKSTDSKSSKLIKIQIDIEEGELKKNISLFLKEKFGKFSRPQRVKLNEDSQLYEYVLDKPELKVAKVQMQGYQSSKEFELSDNLADDHVYKIHLNNGLSYSGRIETNEYEGIPHAFIHIKDPLHKNQAALQSSMTSKEGDFKIEGIRKGPIQVDIFKRGYLRKTLTLSLEDHLEKQTIFLSTGGRLSGTVVDEFNQPVSDIEAILMQKVGSRFRKYFNLSDKYPKTISADGSFAFHTIDPGTYRIDLIDEKGIGESELIEVKDGDDIENILITFKKGLELSGQIVDTNGHPIPNLDLKLRNKKNFSEKSVTKSDTEGNFSFKGLDQNEYYLYIEHKSYELQTGTYYSFIDYEAGKKDIRLTARKSQLVEVFVETPDQKKLKDYQVYRLRSENIEEKVELESQNGQRFSFFDTNFYSPKTESYQLVVKAKGYNSGLSETIGKEHKELVKIKLQPERVLKILVQDALSQPIKGARLKYRLSPDYSSDYFSYLLDSYYSDLSGLIELGGISNNTYDFEIEMAGFPKKFFTLDIQQDQTEPYKVTLSKGGGVKGYVRHPDGTGIAGKYIKLRTDKKNSFHSYQAMTDQDGAFEFKNVSDGAYIIFDHNHPDPNFRHKTKTYKHRCKKVLVETDKTSIVEIISKSEPIKK